MDPKKVTNLLASIKRFCSKGLRTLTYAYKEISETEYTNICHLLNAALTDVEQQSQRLQEVYGAVETDLNLLGCSAVEDRLQEDVWPTLQCLRRAGIQVWILTGDQEETAINISLACGHMNAEMTKIKITNQCDQQQCKETLLMLDEILTGDNLWNNQNSEMLTGNESTIQKSSYALVVDGVSLEIILQSEMCRQQFLKVCLSSAAVLCCRMTPLQKAEVVNLVKQQRQYLTQKEIFHCRQLQSSNLLIRVFLSRTPITAAIGDGANDVSMIRQAHIGFGLFGKEGRQAAQCSDFALPKFKCLRQVLLVHGNYSYIRLVTLILYSLYKNTVFVLISLFYMIDHLFAGSLIYDNIMLGTYNVSYTSVPILVYCILEKRFSSRTLLNRPFFYHHFLSRNAMFTYRQLALWLVMSLYHTFIIWSGSLLFNYCMDPLSAVTFGKHLFFSVFLVVSGKMATETRYWTKATFYSYIFTFVLNMCIIILGNFIPHFPWESYHEWFLLFSMASSWFTWLWTVLTALLPDIIMRSWRDIYDQKLMSMSSKDIQKKEFTMTRMFTNNFKLFNIHQNRKPWQTAQQFTKDVWEEGLCVVRNLKKDLKELKLPSMKFSKQKNPPEI